MNKEKITITLSLAEFDELRDMVKDCTKMHCSLHEQLKKCFQVDTSAYEKALRDIDNGPLEKDKELLRAVKSAEDLIDVKLDIKQLRKVIIKKFSLA